MAGTPDGTPNTLSDLGLETQRNGSFTLNSARLAAALARDTEGAPAMFTTGISGVYATIDNISRGMSVVSNPGSLAGSVNRYTEQLRKVDEVQAALAVKQEQVRLRLTARFAVSDSRIGAARSTLTFLQNQIDAWNNQGK
jgi:flagellar hook-associated protein 2